MLNECNGQVNTTKTKQHHEHYNEDQQEDLEWDRGEYMNHMKVEDDGLHQIDQLIREAREVKWMYHDPNCAKCLHCITRQKNQAFIPIVYKFSYQKLGNPAAIDAHSIWSLLS